MAHAVRRRQAFCAESLTARGEIPPSDVIDPQVWRTWAVGLRRLRQLEEENAKLKRLVADLSVDKAMLQDVLAKKL